MSGRSRAEEELVASEARYRTLFEYAPNGLLIANAESYYLDANASICRMLGYAREELIGKHASDIVVADEIPNIGPALHAINSASEYRAGVAFPSPRRLGVPGRCDRDRDAGRQPPGRDPRHH